MSADDRPTMLLVDDEVENIELLRRMFRKDFSIETALSGEEGVERLNGGAFDVIITDQMMPGMSGTDLLEESLRLAPDAVRILVTGFPNLASAMSSINEGRAFRFFTKPLIRDELRGAVDEALSRLRAVQVKHAQAQGLEEENATLTQRINQLEARVQSEVHKRIGEALRELEALRAGVPFDEETGLYKRETMLGRLEEEVARSGRFGLIFSFVLVRVADYEALSEQEDAGAAALDHLTALLRLSSRRYDSTARWSEDCFALLMPHSTAGSAGKRVERMLEAAGAAAPTGEESEPTLALQLVAGLAVYPSDGTTRDELVAAAERAVASRATAGDDSF